MATGEASPPTDPDVMVQTMVAAGALASGVASEIIQPLLELRDSLAEMVGALDRHIGEAKGPTPYPWPHIKALRERLAEAYLTSRLVSRLAGDLSTAVDPRPRDLELVDINKTVEAAVNLTRHQMSPNTEVFIDFGQIPEARCHVGELVLAVARLLMISADSVRNAAAGAAVSIRTRLDHDEVVVTIYDNGDGRSDDATRAQRFLDRLANRLGGRFTGTSKPGQGSAFELRWPLEDKR
jgi:signal transduction histidine kinase